MKSSTKFEIQFEILENIIQDTLDSDNYRKAKTLPLVLSHNDMYYRNFLWNGLKFDLIDFEYSGINLFGLDVLNFHTELLYDYDFNTYPFFQLNYDQEHFSDASLTRVYKYFVFFYNNPGFKLPEHNIAQSIDSLPEFVNMNMEIVNKLVSFKKLYGIIINCFWVLWSFYNISQSSAYFDFLQYENSRFSLLSKFYQS